MTTELTIKTKLPEQELAKLPEKEKLFIQLYEGIRIVEMNEHDLLKRCREIVSASYVESGIRLPEGQNEANEHLEMLSNSLKNDLKDYHRFMTIEEIRESFRRGARKVYGDFHGINISTFTDWINKFRFDKERADSISKRERIMKPKEGLTHPEREQIFNEALKDCMEYFKQKGEVIDTGGAIFDGLWKRKKITLTPEQALSYKEQASKNEFMRLDNERKKASQKLDRMAINKIDIQLSELIEDGNIAIKIEAKRLALTDYFNSIHQ